MSRLISIAVLLTLIVLLGSTFYRVISPFLMPLFLAAALAVICQPLQKYFLRKTVGRPSWAAALTTATVTMMIVLPLVVGTFIAATNLYDVADQRLGGDWRRGLDLLWKHVVMPVLERISPFVPGGLTDEKLIELERQFTDNMQSVAVELAGTTFSIASSTVGMFVSLAVSAGAFLTALYFFLADGPAILATAEELIPLPPDYQRKLADKFANTVRAVVTATFLAAFAQGLATAAALQVCGIGHFFIFVVIASIMALIPLAGAWMVWGPCAVWLAVQGHWFAAIGLCVWGLAIVGMIDNTVKMLVLQSEADLHPLIAFISVIGALQVMGLWGIFIGPIVASCLFALIQLFNAELKELARERERKTLDSPPAEIKPSHPVEDVAVSAVMVSVTEKTPKSSGGATKTRGKRRR